MSLLIVIRGANGVCTWQRVPHGRHAYDWQCTRDKFLVVGPSGPADTERALVAIALHSQSLVGTIGQVVELDI